MPPLERFRYCPRCGHALATIAVNPLACVDCGFTYFFNPTVAAGAFISDEQGKMLFVRRAKDPAKGLLGVPGGFIDVGESAEEALRREVREEVNLEIVQIRFVCSCPNYYHYRDVTYPVCDLMFAAVAINPHTAQALDGVDAFEWHHPASVSDIELAFPSIRMARGMLVNE